MLTPTLFQFFRRQLAHGLSRQGLSEPLAVNYISDMLSRFAQTRQLYAIRDRQGIPLEHLVDLEAERLALQVRDGAGVHRARELRLCRHLGEFALFMSGFFRPRLQSRGQLGYYIDCGRNAFWHCAALEREAARRRLFQSLYCNFALISHTLHELRQRRFNNTPAPVAGPRHALWHL